jgi:hypothetical protein
VKFYKGRLVALAIGIPSPITDLVNGIIDAVVLAAAAIDRLVKWSLVWIGFSTQCER